MKYIKISHYHKKKGVIFIKSKKDMAKISLILSIISLISSIFNPSPLILSEIFVFVGLILAIAGIVLGFLSVKEVKGMSIASICIGFISVVLLLLCFLGLVVIGSVKNCVDQKNGKSMCEFSGTEIEVSNTFLRENQKQKEE